MISYVTAADCILHCSDKNMVLTTSIAAARARPFQYYVAQDISPQLRHVSTIEKKTC